MFTVDAQNQHHIQQRAQQYRQKYSQFAQWAKGYGLIRHSDETHVRVFDLCQQLLCENPQGHPRYPRIIAGKWL